MPWCSAMERFWTSYSDSMRDSNTRINVLVCSEDDRYDVMSSTHIHDRYQSATHFRRSIEVLITHMLCEMATISSISHHPSPWLVELCEASMVSRAGYNLANHKQTLFACLTNEHMKIMAGMTSTRLSFSHCLQ